MAEVALAVTVVALVALLVAEKQDSMRLRWISKPVASTGFITYAVLNGALDSGFGQAVLAALVLSWWGDVLLIPKDRHAFLAGVAAFGLGHVAFAGAFVVLGVHWPAALVAAVALTAPAILLGRWFVTKAPPELKGAVAGYIVVISVMVALAYGTVRAGNDPTVLAAACVFYASDISVAIDRFVKKSFTNRLWGLPAYYGAQLLFGWAVLRHATTAAT